MGLHFLTAMTRPMHLAYMQQAQRVPLSRTITVDMLDVTLTGMALSTGVREWGGVEGVKGVDGWRDGGEWDGRNRAASRMPERSSAGCMVLPQCNAPALGDSDRKRKA